MEPTNCPTFNPQAYKGWFKEYMSVEVLECEKGFMTYKMDSDNCVIFDMFVLPEFRGSKGSAEMADIISKKALSHGCKFLIGFVNFPSPYPEQSLLCQLRYGFKIKEVTENKIILIKEIKNG